MRALVLAAGRGTRLNHLTRDRPKSLVTLEGKTLLEWQIASLRAAGVSDIAVVRGYRGEMIDLPGLAYLENADWARTNMVHSLRCADEWLKASVCIVSYGDIVYHPSLVSALVDTPGEIVVAYDVLWERLWQERFEDPAVDVESFRIEDGWIVEIGGRRQFIGIGRRPIPGTVQVGARGLAQDTWVFEPDGGRDGSKS